MSLTKSFDELAQRLQKQEDTVAQLVKIIAATNHRVVEVKLTQEKMMRTNSMK